MHKFQLQIKSLGIFLAAAIIFSAVGISTVGARPTVVTVVRPPSVSDRPQSERPLPDGIIAWDALVKTSNVEMSQKFARFTFCFTNISSSSVTILNVHPSCGCTTAELPPVPWTIPAGSRGQIKVKVNLAGKRGTLFKSVSVTTDKGRKTLMVRINIRPKNAQAKSASSMTEAQLAAGIAAAKVDRQAVFKGSCASCHLKNVQGEYGQQLFAATCAICHEAKPRATMVPDLHNLKVPTDERFWRMWITSGKAGSMMPAFGKAQGGPLTDMQIASLAAYLNAVNPSHVPPVVK